MMTHAFHDHYDVAILVTADTAFLPALRYVQGMGKKVEVASFSALWFQEMAHMANRFHDLQGLPILQLSSPEACLRTRKDKDEITFIEYQQQVPCMSTTKIIRRTGPNELKSIEFTSSTYSVHIGMDRKMLRIRPDEKGMAVCSSGSLILTGLDQVSSFNGPTDLAMMFCRESGDYVVRLDQSPDANRVRRKNRSQRCRGHDHYCRVAHQQNGSESRHRYHRREKRGPPTKARNPAPRQR
jgi:hypothetical protein